MFQNQCRVSQMIRHSIILFTLALIIFSLLPTVFEDTARDYVGTIESTKVVAQIIAGILSLNTFWAIIRSIRHYRTYDFRIAWQASVQVVGWLPIAISSIAISFALLFNIGGNDTGWFRGERVIASIIPLSVGMTAAIIFSSTDDPMIETQLALPRPIAWVLLERLAVILLPQMLIAQIGTGIILMTMSELDVAIMVIRWLPPSLCLMGVGSYITLKSRNVSFGLVSVGVLWAITLLFGEVFLPSDSIFYPLNHLQPYLWVFNPYVQPNTLPIDAYWINRMCVALLGITLLALTVHQLRDEEMILLGD